MTTNDTQDRGPALYVGTYGKYAAGSIFGAWLYINDYTDAEEFLKACYALHKDERDPELMFQDSENIPDSLYHESMNADELQMIFDWNELGDYDREVLEAYEETHGVYGDTIRERFSNALDAFFCQVDPLEGWRGVAQHCVDEGLIEIPDHLQAYFDYDSYGRDLSCEMSMAENGMVFH